MRPRLALTLAVLALALGESKALGDKRQAALLQPPIYILSKSNGFPRRIQADALVQREAKLGLKVGATQIPAAGKIGGGLGGLLSFRASPGISCKGEITGNIGADAFQAKLAGKKTVLLFGNDTTFTIDQNPIANLKYRDFGSDAKGAQAAAAAAEIFYHSDFMLIRDACSSMELESAGLSIRSRIQKSARPSEIYNEYVDCFNAQLNASHMVKTSCAGPDCDRLAANEDDIVRAAHHAASIRDCCGSKRCMDQLKQTYKIELIPDPAGGDGERPANSKGAVPGA